MVYGKEEEHMFSFEKLEVWQKTREFIKLIYKFTHAPVREPLTSFGFGTVRGFAQRRKPEKKGATAVKPWGSTANFPKEEQFGLSQHTRKSAISVLSNIAEATSRFGDEDFKRFIEIALGSLYETINQLFIALGNNYLNKINFEVLYKEAEVIAKMLSKLSKSRGK